MKRPALAMTALGLLVLSGCSAPSPDQAFVSTVREEIPAIADASDAEIADLGHQVCDLFDGNDSDDAMAALVSTTRDVGLSSSDAGTLAGAAVGAYCPEFSDEIG